MNHSKNWLVGAALTALCATLAMRTAARGAIHGFGGFAPVNTANDKHAGFSDHKKLLTLTTGGQMEAASAFFPKRQKISAFNATFTYQAKTTGGAADGVAMVLQNDPRGVKALGSAQPGQTFDGGSLGYGQPNGITRSGAFEVNIYRGNGVGIAVNTSGATGGYGGTAPVNLRSGHKIRFVISYNGLWLHVKATDLTTHQSVTSAQPIDLVNAIGATKAYVGFTGATGDGSARQTISDFTFSAAHAKAFNPSSLSEYVDPFVGTGNGPGGGINLFPGPSRPFGMVQLSPDTETSGYGYHYYQHDILGFSMTHMSGPGCNNEGDVFFTATTGKVHTRMANFQSPYSHAQEAASPGYYRVKLLRWGINAQLTSTDRCGLARFTFPAGKQANVLIPISQTLNFTAGAHVHIVNKREVDGYVIDHAFCGNPQPYTVHFVMKFSRPFKTFGTWKGTGVGMNGRGTLHARKRTATQIHHNQWIGGYVSWPKSNHQRVITVKVGISYVSLNGAKNNLRKEAARRRFTAVRRAATAAWNKSLKAITVRGGTAGERMVFYTALYHSLLMPSIFSDADGRYLGFDKKIHHAAPGHMIYANYSGWDIYRSEMPLLAIIKPRRVQDMCQSITLMYKQGGWIDRWPQINLYTNVMCGSPLTTVMCNAWDDGLHGFDMKTAWRGMVKDATQAPPPGHPYQGESNINAINKLHYDPDNYEGYGSVSQIQEDCVAYSALYHLAKRLHKPAAEKLFYKRALYYRNVFDHKDGYFRPRLSNGQWRTPFKPTQGHGFIEGNGWHYQWLAPQDMAWLVHAMGKARFNRRLTRFFSYKTPGWFDNYYNPYNEVDLEAPFEFDFSGEPWKTQAVVRKVLRENYTLSPDGVPGNDDCGEMSSWAVMGMMGLYAEDPGKPVLELSSPSFRSITVHLQAPYKGRQFVIKSSRGTQFKPYIQKLTVNGKTWPRCYVPTKLLTDGGTLKYTLGKKPNKRWAVTAADEPPSLSMEKP